MAAVPKQISPGELAELDDVVDQRFRPGDYGKIMITGLTDLVKHYLPPEKHAHVLGFLTWVPPDHLEQYLVHALEHGADLTRPKTGKARRKASRRP
jgi:hypothetical protein